MFVEELMFVKIGNKNFHLVEEKAKDMIESQTVKVNEILEVLKPKKWMGGVRVSGLPRCVLSSQFRDAIKAVEDKKCEKREAIEKRKAEWKVKAEEKK